MGKKKIEPKEEVVPWCPGCGHRFYKDSPFYAPPNEKGLCRYCVEEAAAPKKPEFYCSECGERRPGYDVWDKPCSDCRESPGWHNYL